METQEQGHTSTNVKETNSFDFSNTEETVKTEMIIGTPFGIKWVKDRGWSFGVGEYKLSIDYEEKEEMLKKLNLKEIKHKNERSTYEIRNKNGIDWILISNVISIYVEMWTKVTENIKGI